jgi:hypothetical protein
MMRAAVMRLLVAASCLLCPPLLAAADAPEAVAIGIVWWPADPDDAMAALGSEIEDCLIARIEEVAPEIAVTRQHAIRDMLFPLLEPSTQPTTEADFAALLARADVRARLARRGLAYLVAFSGGTRRDAPGGFILCGAGYGGGGCLGFAWRGETTALDAALWSLDSGTEFGHEEAMVEVTSVLPAFGLPVPIPARTQAQACRELGGRIARTIRAAKAEER